MVTLTILAIMFIAFIMIALLIAGVFGTAFVMVFGDIIVCIAIIVFAFKMIRKRK